MWKTFVAALTENKKEHWLPHNVSPYPFSYSRFPIAAAPYLYQRINACVHIDNPWTFPSPPTACRPTVNKNADRISSLSAEKTPPKQQTHSRILLAPGFGLQDKRSRFSLHPEILFPD